MGVGASVNKSSKGDGGKVNKPDQTADSHKKQSSVISSANDSNNNNNQRASKRITSWNTNKNQQPPPQQQTADSNNNDNNNNLTPLSPPVTTENANRKSTRFSTASGSSGHGSGSSAPNNDTLNNSIGSSGGGGRTVLTKFNSLRNLMRMNIFENSKVEPEELIGMKGDALNPIPEASNSRHNSSHHLNNSTNDNSNRNSNRSVSGRKYSMSEATEKLIINALSESNYLSPTPATATLDGVVSTSTTATSAAANNSNNNNNNNNNSKHIQELILRRLEKEEFDADDVIIREGEKGDRIYIIESGVVRVTQQNIEIREMTVGSLFGDIALTYNALRTATVTCVTKTIVWSLRRDVFKRIQENSTSDIDKRRTEWLINIPEFAILSALDQAKLVGCLQPRIYDIGDYIYREDEISNQCVLIEYGLAAVFSSKPLVSEEDDDIDKELFIYRHVPLNTAALNKANGLQTGMSGKCRNFVSGETSIGGSGSSTNNLCGQSTDGMGNSNSNINDNNNPARYRSKMKVSKINEMISKIVQSTFKNTHSPPSPSKANAHTASTQSLLTLSQKLKATQTLSQKNILGSSAKPSMGSSNSMNSSVSDNAANNSSSSSSNSTTVSGGVVLTSTSHHESVSPRESSSNSSTNILNNSNSRTSLSGGNITTAANNNNGSPSSNKYITKNNTNSNKTGGGSNASSPIKSSILKSSNVNVNNHISHNYSQSVFSGSNSASSASASTGAHSDDPSILLSHPSSQPFHASVSTTYSQKQFLYQQQQKSDLSTETFITMLNEGCVVGVGILRGKANIPGAWPWLQQQQSQQSSSSSSSEKGVGGERISINSIDATNLNNSSGRSHNNNGGTIGAIVPISVIATERVEALILTVDAFENAFGTIDATTTAAANNSTSGNNSDIVASGIGGTVLIGGITLKSRSNSQNELNSQIKSTSSEASLNSSVNNRSVSNFSATTSATTDTKKMLTFTHHRKVAVEDKPIPLKKFSESQFQQSVILGNGSYGIVVLGEYKRTSSNENSNIDLNTSTAGGAVAVTDKNNNTAATTPALSIMDLTIQNRNKQQQQQANNSATTTSNLPAYYALKIISKNDIVEMGQVRHVVDEMKLLSLMSSRFIIKLYGTYQTLNEIVLVTEVVYGCDLWSIIYDQANFVQLNNNADSGNNNNYNNTGNNMGGGMTHSSSNSHLMTQQNNGNSNSNINNKDDNEPLLGLPMSLVQFYAASLIAALAHIHDKGVVYRDIKPENIMIDEKGYIRLIDFGFAKKVPYTKIMKATGQERAFVKTYTLCGTPEYLSPEMIFNLGHDQSTDIWSVGILIHEMIVAATPFAPKRADNITELFTNIALVKKNGYSPGAELLSCTGSGNAVIDLIEQMLQAEPTKRIGVIKQSTWSILRHLFFLGFPMNKIHDGSYIPEYLPRKPELFESVVNSTATREYKGDQAVFKDF